MAIVIDKLSVELTFEADLAIASILRAEICLTPWWRWFKLWRLGRELRTAEAAAVSVEKRKQLRKIAAQVGAE